ncbi:MAG: hypothetical protein IPJ82_14245 [Lewinellaceae bacterium]|nr:hypothetical protein [Lewinellaceae bacterium]
MPYTLACMRQLPILPFFVGIACALAAAFRQPDEAVAVIPGWHTVVFPSYFQAGAVLSGLAFLQIGLLLARRFFSPVKQYITIDRTESLNAAILGAGTLVLWAYLYHFLPGAPRLEQQSLFIRGNTECTRLSSPVCCACK